jgi:hypothetical protein
MRQVVKQLLERQPNHREFERFLLRMRVAVGFIKDVQACMMERYENYECRLCFPIMDSYTCHTMKGKKERFWCFRIELRLNRNHWHNMATVCSHVREEALFCGDKDVSNFAQVNAMVLALATPVEPVSIYSENETQEQEMARKLDELKAMVWVPRYGNFYFEVLVGETVMDGALRCNERKRYTKGAFAGVLEQRLLMGLR